MKILFVTSHAFLLEPLGTMLMSAIGRNYQHKIRLVILRRGNVVQQVDRWKPDVVAYSAMSTDMPMFRAVDKEIRKKYASNGKMPFRIMGGPHPTYSPSVIDDLQLDAICQGDGDRAFPELLKRLENNENLERIPNISLTRNGAETKELYDCIDDLPFSYREDYYRLVPYLRESGLRSFVASRGCPYDCSYCYNHAFKGIFEGCGPILRRHSVDRLLDEIEYVIKIYPPVRLIRFGDDTFTFKVDAWLQEFARKYKTRIKLPFYCQMRSNTLTEDTARLLSEAGCQSVSISIESGSERIRNQILKRNLSNEKVIRSFEVAKKYKLHTFANTMLGIPGTTLEDDFESLEFSRKISPSAPAFTICCPYPGTEIWKKAIEGGHLDENEEVETIFTELSVLKSYSQREKEIQARICFLGPIFCFVPEFLVPFMCFLMRSRVPLRLANRIGLTYRHYLHATRIFPQAIPRSPGSLFRLVCDTFKVLG